MRESRTSGSGRGDQGNPVPYRHRIFTVPAGSAKVSCLNRQRALNLGGGNASSCPSPVSAVPVGWIVLKTRLARLSVPD